MKFHTIIIGAGFAGSVVAERIARVLNEKVLIIEKRNHIGGNAYDHYDKHGILVHKYGPHIFHTNQKHVWDYLSNFTDWFIYEHKILGLIDGKQIPIPFNYVSLKKLFPPEKQKKLKKKLINRFGENVNIPILRLREIKDQELKELADYIYEKVFLSYTRKQWGLTPEELNPSVTGRVPIRISKDDRCFQDTYQGIPLQGYTKLFENILDHSNIEIILNTDYKKIMSINCSDHVITFMGEKFSGNLIYTGKIDELYDYCFGELPYRSLRFEHKNINKKWYQKTGTINYPNDFDYTRITEFKHMTGQRSRSTSIVAEYPQAYERNVEGKNIPYYPIPRSKNQELYQKYRGKARGFKQLILLGRLAEYHYYDMHQIIAKSLRVFRECFNH